ncbi:MAG: efflux RND transporter periplasmic adaptor subunit [Phycisphaerae bacterium]
MKNLVIVLLLVAVTITGGMSLASRLKVSLPGTEGRKEKIIRGDLRIDIHATGEVRPARRVELKSEASGEVLRIERKPGDRVKQGDLLIVLEPDEEQRNVDKASVDVARAQAGVTEAEIRLELSKGSDLDSARSNVVQAEQTLRLSKFRLEKLRTFSPGQTSEEELLQREVIYERDKASLDQARASLQKAELAIPLAQASLDQAKANLDRLNTVLKDAEDRLEETEIIAPIDGIVGDIKVEVGDVIQGGKTTFTGGTVLATLLDMGRLRVGAEVDEADIESVRQLAPAWAIPGRTDDLQMPSDLELASRDMQNLPVINVESFQDEEFVGMIELINPEPRVMSSVVTYIVEVIVVSDNRDLLLPGMRADVQFTSKYLEDILLCPNEAIKEDRNSEYGVYLALESVEGEPDSEFVPCTFGESNGRFSRVKCDGLKEEDVVFTRLPVKQRRNDEES